MYISKGIILILSTQIRGRQYPFKFMHGRGFLWSHLLNFMTKALHRVFFELESAFSEGLYPMGNKSTMYLKGKKQRLNTTQASFIFYPVLCSMYSKLFMHLECSNITFWKADEVYFWVM